MTQPAKQAALAELLQARHNIADPIYGGAILSSDGLHVVLSSDTVDECIKALTAQQATAGDVCNECNGDGAVMFEYAVMVCCGNPTPHGECCQNGVQGTDAAHAPCAACEGTGKSITPPAAPSDAEAIDALDFILDSIKHEGIDYDNELKAIEKIRRALTAPAAKEGE